MSINLAEWFSLKKKLGLESDPPVDAGKYAKLGGGGGGA